MKKIIGLFITVLILSLSVFLSVKYYGFIFSKKVTGVIDNLQRVDANISLLQNSGTNDQLPSQLFSFAIAIKTENGEIFTASSEDRRWAVAKIGQCVEARFFPYPFWNLEKSGLFFNAKLLTLKECSK